MPRRPRLIAMLTVTSIITGCSDSYKFQGNTDVDVSGDANAPMAIDNGDEDENTQECSSRCQADGQSSGGA